jgi:hypothetical protein
MKKTELAEKIGLLPDNLKSLAEEYIDFLLQKATKEANNDEELKKVLNSRAQISADDIENGRVFSREEVRVQLIKAIEQAQAK